MPTDDNSDTNVYGGVLCVMDMTVKFGDFNVDW